jgi:hypothetical protein
MRRNIVPRTVLRVTFILQEKNENKVTIIAGIRRGQLPKSIRSVGSRRSILSIAKIEQNGDFLVYNIRPQIRKEKME